MDILVKCLCGNIRYINDADREKLEACPNCGDLARIPKKPADLARDLERIAHLAFEEDMPIAKEAQSPTKENLISTMEEIKHRLRKAHVCHQCYNTYDAFFVSEIPGTCGRCAEKFKKEVVRDVSRRHTARYEKQTEELNKTAFLRSRRQFAWGLSLGTMLGCILGASAVFFL